GVRRTPGADGARRARGHPAHAGRAAGSRSGGRFTMRTAIAACTLLVLPALSAAHPLGNFTTNRYAALTVQPREVRIAYAVDLAELPAYREIQVVDSDGDGTIDPAEREAYTSRQAAELARNLELTLDGERLTLSPIGTALEMAPGAGGLRTLRLDATYRADLPRSAGELAFRDHNYADRPGWQEIVATPAGGARRAGGTGAGRAVNSARAAHSRDKPQPAPPGPAAHQPVTAVRR